MAWFINSLPWRKKVMPGCLSVVGAAAVRACSRHFPCAAYFLVLLKRKPRTPGYNFSRQGPHLRKRLRLMAGWPIAAAPTVS